jgi:hypothetical protein
LHIAAQHGHISAFLLFLDLGVDPSARNNAQSTPIHEALEFCDGKAWVSVLRDLPATWYMAWNGELLIAASRNPKMLGSALPDILAVSHPKSSNSIINRDKGVTQF